MKSMLEEALELRKMEEGKEYHNVLTMTLMSITCNERFSNTQTYYIRSG